MQHEECPQAVHDLEPIIEKHLVGDLDLNLVKAVIWQESHGNPWVPRYEEGFIWFYDHGRKLALAEQPYGDTGKNRHKARTVLGATEFNCQSMSWGPMQVMGAAARERGFRGGMGELSTPECGIHYGCLHLWEYAFNYGRREMEEALSKWNGGANKNYPQEVILKLGQLIGTA